MRGFLLFFALLFFISFISAQNESLPNIERFITLQRIQINSAKDLDTLAGIITIKYPDSLSRVKAAYVWVAKNITYTEEGNSGKLQHTATNIDSVLKYKSTICAGYVNVFCLLCNKVGVVCQQIDGFGRTGTQPLIDAHFLVNHAWAAVWLNDKWNLTDPTWGSGYTLEGTATFISATNDWYFFTEPATFILDHYPKKAGWQLLKDTVSWEAFMNYPGVCLGAKEDEVSTCLPAQSRIRAAAGSQVQFSFTSKKTVAKHYIIKQTKRL